MELANTSSAGGYGIYVRMTEHDTSSFKEEIIQKEGINHAGSGSKEEADDIDIITSTDLGLGTSIATSAVPSTQVHAQITRVPNFNEVTK